MIAVIFILFFRFVEAGSGQQDYRFTIPLNACAPKPTPGTCRGGNCRNSNEIIIILQTDDTVQELWDVARRVSCAAEGHNEKTVYFKPFMVDMLEVTSVPMESSTIECWMDIQRGSYPSVSSVAIIQFNFFK